MMELTVEALKDARFKGPVAFYDGRGGMARQDYVCADEPRFGYFWQRKDRKDKGRQAYMVDGIEVSDLAEAAKRLAQPIPGDSPDALRKRSIEEFKASPSLGSATRAQNDAQMNAAVGPMGSVRAWMRRASHPWHVGINAYSEAQREAKAEWPRWMYNAKHAAEEISRSMHLFAGDRAKGNGMMCALGATCATCPILAHVEKAMVADRAGRFPHDIEDEDIDAAKAWTCIGHILQTKTEITDGAFFTTKEDRDHPEFFLMSPKQDLEKARALLLTVIDEEHADGFITHRAKKKAPLTFMAAKGVVRQLTSPEIKAAFPDPNLAIEEICERGWQTIKPEWLQNGRQNVNQNDRSRRRGLDAAADTLRQEIVDEQQRASGPQGGSDRTLSLFHFGTEPRH